jgi:hypothetical protein
MSSLILKDTNNLCDQSFPDENLRSPQNHSNEITSHPNNEDNLKSLKIKKEDDYRINILEENIQIKIEK